ncbi:ATP-binding protein [Streptomyces sp. NBRC 110028]|uniref:methylation-associated defense system ATP-binding protein MAD8 n=1 Tax=Streptomyces sp. NBRC 110028 TaxID=1621260 RepID=UPI0006E1654B|nr:ATP-binding protein [Streptomyces sp. NBRC 110028]
MARGLTEITEAQWRDALEHALLPRLAAVLRGRQAGHCMRLGDLDTDLAALLVRGLRVLVPDAQVFVLDSGDGRTPTDVAVTSTKLVELRNPDENGGLRPPLLVFVPPGTRASAEDSFGVATFERLSLDDVHAKLKASLLRELPEALRQPVTELLNRQDRQVTDDGAVADDRAAVRYLLTLRENDHDPEAAGAAVYLLGLIPDFGLFQDMTLVGRKADRNRRTVAKLTEATATDRQRVLSLGLPQNSPAAEEFVRRLVQFAARTGLDTPSRWCRAIAMDPDNWPLAFHHWPQENTPGGEQVGIEVHELTVLPKAGQNEDDLRNHPALERLFGGQYLLPGGLSSLPVAFTVDPDPRHIAGLARFSIQILAESETDEGRGDTTVSPTGFTATVSVAKTAKTVYKTSIKLKKGRKADWEEGWHFVRVTPLDANGDPLRVASADSTHRPHESDRFYVVPEGEFDDPPLQRSQHAPGLAQAINRLRFTARAEGRDPWRVSCREVGWGARTAKTRPLRARFGPAGPVTIDLPIPLAEAEERMLARPYALQGPRLSVDASGRWHLSDDESPAVTPAEGSDLDRYLQDRAALFAAVRGDADGAVPLVVEGTDPRTMHKEAESCAEAYLRAVTRCVRALENPRGGTAERDRAELALLLRTDTMVVELADTQDGPHQAVLVAPTHPLRVLWWCGQAALADHWLDRIEGHNKDRVLETLHSLVERLAPLGFPLVVPLATGELTFAAGQFTDYWQVCLPSETADPRGTVSRLGSALGVSDGATASGMITGADLADRVERYVRLHPYADSLVINALGVGRGEVLASMLTELQSRKHLTRLRYTIRLFTDRPQEPWVGEALTALFSPGSGPRAAAAEPFGTPGDALRPKLAVVVRDATDLRTRAAEFPAHLSVLFDPFGGEQYDIAPAARTSGRAAAHGLVQELTSHYAEDEESVAWSRQPRHGATDPVPGAEETGDLMAALPEALSAAVVAVTSGEPRPGQLPQITLRLSAQDKALLHDVHQASDWVITVDRTLGVEYFDHGRADRPEYVIDYSATAQPGMGHHIVVSSRSVDELRALVGPVLGDKQLSIAPHHVTTFFDQLRELSGSFAFKLAALGSSSRTEVLGLALARLYLGYQGALHNQILIPLDAHTDLYGEAQRRIAAGDAAVRLHRTDLALFDLDAERRIVVCRLIEVKCFTGVGGLGAYDAKKKQISQQIDNSREILAAQFDPLIERPDRPLQNLTLRSLLGHYLGRANRYGLFDEEGYDEARWLLDHLDHGYALEFSRTGLLFDLDGDGTDVEVDGGITFHRIGRHQVTELLDAVETEYLGGPVRSAPHLLAEAEVPGITRGEATRSLRPRDRSRELPEEPAPLSAVLDEEFVPVAADGDDTVGKAAGEARIPGSRQASEHLADTDQAPGSQDAAAAGMDAGDTGDLRNAAEAEGTVPDSEPEKPSQPPSFADSADSADCPAVPDVFLGVSKPTAQYGLLGVSAGRKVALDLNETHTISLFGVQGGGKSYTLGSILEMASLPAVGVNHLSHPLASIVFHYSDTQDYAPEFTSMTSPNSDEEQLAALRERYGAEPAALSDVLLLAPADKVEDRKQDYPDLDVRPLTFSSSELKAAHWRFLMGAVGNQALYIRQLGRIMKANRNDLTLDAIRLGVEQSSLSDALKQLAYERLDLAAEYIDDNARLQDLVRPGRLIIVDLRDDYIGEDEALGLFVVLMQLFADARHEGQAFNKLVVFDEAHKYIRSPDLVDGLVSSVREMRHKGMSILVASQDPPSVPISLIELSNHMVLHKFTSPAWLKHLQKANAALSTLTAEKMASLNPGEAFVWSSKATDEAFVRGAVKIRCRPRVTRHGGATRTAIG